MLQSASEEVSAVLGSPLSLPCRVLSALPPPSRRWSHEGLPVAEGGGRRLLSDGTLQLLAVRRRDAGLYRCTVENAAGATSITTRVNVHCE